MFSLFSAAALAAAAPAALPAALPATPPAALPATYVRHADLDLATAHGRARLDRRIARAAQFVCRPESRLTPQLVAGARHCTRDTIAATRTDRERVIAAGGAAPITVAVR